MGINCRGVTGGESPAEGDWRMYVEGSVVVAEFPPGATMDAETVADVERRWEDLVVREEVTGHVAVIESEDNMDFAVLDAAESAARTGTDHGVRRWAVVADDIKRLAVANRVDVPGLEVLGTDDREEAMAWAREA